MGSSESKKSVDEQQEAGYDVIQIHNETHNASVWTSVSIIAIAAVALFLCYCCYRDAIRRIGRHREERGFRQQPTQMVMVPWTNPPPLTQVRSGIEGRRAPEPMMMPRVHVEAGHQYEELVQNERAM